MGRPRELTDEERQSLLKRGYEPIEVWVPNWNNFAFVAEIEEECRLIREADQRSGMNETLDAFLTDVWNDLR